MRIGTKIIRCCNNCPAYDWAGESVSKGDHGMRCNFGAFHSFYDDEHPIPENCPIKSSDLGSYPTFMCDICGWKGTVSKMEEAGFTIGNKEVYTCPECGSIIPTNKEDEL